MTVASIVTHPAFVPALAFILGAFILARHLDTKKPHLSLIQLLIRGLGYTARWMYSAMVGFDAGYLAYRKELAATKIELENERQLGLLLRSHVEA